MLKDTDWFGMGVAAALLVALLAIFGGTSAFGAPTPQASIVLTNPTVTTPLQETPSAEDIEELVALCVMRQRTGLDIDSLDELEAIVPASIQADLRRRHKAPETPSAKQPRLSFAEVVLLHALRARSSEFGVHSQTWDTLSRHIEQEIARRAGANVPRELELVRQHYWRQHLGELGIYAKHFGRSERVAQCG